jgi:hypothetical protein
LWGTPDAGVACRQLGFPSQGNYYSATMTRNIDLGNLQELLLF